MLFSVALVALWPACGKLQAKEPLAQEIAGKAIAWIRFPDAPEKYAGLPYLWLGRCSVRLKINVPPDPQHRLVFLWGSKNDIRTAQVVINGRATVIKHGGYDGFRWLDLPLGKGKGTGHYVVELAAAGGKPAFIAEVRLVDPHKGTRPLNLQEKPSHLIELELLPVRQADAFADMRPLWDTPVHPVHPVNHPELEAAFRQAEKNARTAAEQFYRCNRYVHGWLAHADPTTGLIPRNLGRNNDIWNAQDAAADNYPFMVLTCALTERHLFETKMLEMLRTETKLTSRLGALPDTWSFSKQNFASPEPQLAAIIFGSSEYVKDGLLPLTEWLGPSPWCDRMLAIVDDIWQYAPVATAYGKIPSENVEVNGEQLQALSRLYWLTGNEKYLDWAVRLGDYYLLGDHHPTRNLQRLRLRDHGCEVISGLSELYATCHFARPEKKKQYQKPLREIYDCILELGRDNRGMLYNWIEPSTGKHDSRICDTWGYNYNGFYTLYLIDGIEAYRDAVRFALKNLPQLTNYDWGSADEYADSIEGALNLYNREPVEEAARWMDSEIRDMWRKQGPDGVIEGWHGDGNVARTAIMYAFWKTQGTWIDPWRPDVRFGAVRYNGDLLISITAAKPWQGKIHFDKPRHRENMHLPLDYPRINQFPEWFVAEAEKSYEIKILGGAESKQYTGRQLQAGLQVSLEAGKETRIIVSPCKL